MSSPGSRVATRHRLALVLTGVAALVSVPARAVAGPPSEPDDTAAPKMAKVRTLDAALVVEPGATCLSRETLLGAIRSWRERERVDPRVSIRVRGSSEDPRSLRVMIWVQDEVAVDRPFNPAPEDCANLHAVVGLAIAIALDDTLPGELGLVDERAEQARAGEGDLPSFDREERPLPRRRGPALALTAAVGAFAGPTPRLSGGGLLSFDIRPLDHFDVRVGALATHLANYPLDEGRVGITVAAGRLDLCWGTAPLSVRLRVCGGAAGGATVAVGRDYTNNFSRGMPWFAGIVGIDVAVRLIGPLALELRVEGVFPFQRTRIDVRSTGGQLLASERMPVAGLIVGVGPRFEF